MNQRTSTKNCVVYCLVICLSILSAAFGQDDKRPLPKTLSIPADYTPTFSLAPVRYSMMRPEKLAGTPVGELDGVCPIYVMTGAGLPGDPLQEGDMIVGIDGVGLGESPIDQWRKAISESKDPRRGDWKITVTRWRKGALTTLDINIPRPAVKPPLDFTKGERGGRGATRDFNMGPTGVTGLFENVTTEHERDIGRDLTGMSRQILVVAVDKGSPADGILATNDVILGADGTGAATDPVKFDHDARVSFGHAVTDAEARNPATLRLLRWRDGKTDVVTLKLETLGKYSDTAPYNCEKSRAILRKGVDAMVRDDKPGYFGWGILPLLASDDPTNPDNDRNQAKAREWAHKLILPGGEPKLPSWEEKPPWQHGFKMIILGEYYLKTRDEAVLPTLRVYAEHFANHQSWYGTTGHRYADPAPDGSPNGPMGGYGAVNLSGVHGLLGLSLAHKAGVRSESIDAAIRRAQIFFSSYAHKGVIPYGEHEPWLGTRGDLNGKCAATALAFQLLDVYPRESRYFAKIGTMSSSVRELSHGGPFFNSVWPALGAGSIGEKAAAHYFKRSSWHFDQFRRWDGRTSNLAYFGGTYRAMSQEITTLLTYALPLRQLYITGRGQDKSRSLSDEEFKEVVAAEDFDAGRCDEKQLREALSSWNPRVGNLAAQELGARARESQQSKELLSDMHALAGNTNAPIWSRAAACVALGKVGAAESAPVLVSLLDDREHYVRYWAAKALLTVDREAVMPHLDTILRAAVSTARPVFPLSEDDPLQLDHAAIGKLLFDRGGLLYRSLEGVDRALLWPAVRALAKTPTGSGRSPVGNLYKQLEIEDVWTMADTIVESVRSKSPADSMFSGAIGLAGVDALERNSVAETLHVGVFRKHSANPALSGYPWVIKLGPSAFDWDTSGRVLQTLIYRLVTDELAAEKTVRPALAALLDDTKPRRTLTPLKRIEAVTATNPEVTLPAKKTVLKVKATNYALRDEKESTYTWRKVHGAGKVQFAPNATWDSKESTITFSDAKPGKYRFEVTMSDTLGYTTVKETVDVTLLDTSGRLPANRPPVAGSQSVTAHPGLPLAVTLGGSDPEGADLGFAIKGKPSHGTLFGAPPDMKYTADWGYTGTDTFTFDVLDGQGIAATGTISINVTSGKVGLTLYEGFDYKPGPLLEVSGSGGIGLKGAWEGKHADYNLTYNLTDFLVGYKALPSVGSGMVIVGRGRGRATVIRAVDTEALKRDGILGNGRELWLSAMVAPHKDLQRLNTALAIGLQGGADDSRTSVGFAIKTQCLIWATINGDDGKSDMGVEHFKYADALWPREQPAMVVVRCRWGKTDQEPDTVEVYRVVDLPMLGPKLVEKPIATNSGVIDQSKLNTLYISAPGYGAGFYFDEIRVGPSYHSVLLGTVASDKTNPVQKQNTRNGGI